MEDRLESDGVDADWKVITLDLNRCPEYSSLDEANISWPL